MGMVYEFRLGPKQFPVEPQIVGEALEALGGHNSGALTPDAVVEAARPADHPLHPIFEWDDSVAAEAWRRSQASDVLRSVVAIMPERPEMAKPTRAFVSIRADDGPAYIPIRRAMSDPEMRDQVLAGAMRELVSWRRRYTELQELAELFAQIDMFADDHLPNGQPD